MVSWQGWKGMVGLALRMTSVALATGDPGLGTAPFGFSSPAKEWRSGQEGSSPGSPRAHPSAAACPGTASGSRHFPGDRTQPQVTSCSCATLRRLSFGAQTLRELCLQLRLPLPPPLQRKQIHVFENLALHSIPPASAPSWGFSFFLWLADLKMHFVFSLGEVDEESSGIAAY